MSSQPRSFADRAALVTQYGIPVIPVEPRDKKTHLNKWQSLATTDDDQIAAWNEENPEYNCGAVGRKGEFWILDADRFVELSERIKQETGHNLDSIDTLMVQSSKGKMHVYFKHDACSEAMGNFSVDDKDGEFFSTRAHNAYVVAPQSIHPKTGLPYEIIAEPVFGEIPVAPDWLMDWLKTAKRLSVSQKARIAADNEAKIHEGGRDEFLFAEACKLRDTKVSQKAALAALLVVNNDRCVPPMAESDVETKITSAYKRDARAKPANDPAGTDKIFKDSAYGVPPAKVAAPSKPVPALEFHSPQVEGSALDFVCEPLSGEMDGWFPLGSPSLIAGSSGANKSTLMLQLLQAQRYKEPFLGHETNGRPYLIIMFDRGAYSHERTLIRMRFTNEVIPTECMETKVGIEGVREIVRKIEDTVPMPQVVFIDGADMIVEEGNDKRIVVEFLGWFQQIATRYHIAIVLSVGSPKAKAGEGYIAKRDNVSGTEAWARLSETVMLLQYPKGKDTVALRELTVLPRNAKSESFMLVLERGRLRLQTDTDREKQFLADDPALAWVREQARLAETDPTKQWWTVLQLRRATKMKKTAVREWVDEAHDDTHWIVKKSGTGNKGRGKAALYAWNPSDITNSLLVDQKTSDSESDILIEFNEKDGNQNDAA